MDKWAFLLKRLEKSWGAAGKPRRILAAVSGGADSVALLHFLNQFRQKEELEIFVVHVDHGLRGTSWQDGRFVADLCRKMALPCRIEKVQPASSSEMDAREARYAALYKIAEMKNCSAIALAHHRRDQAETVLMHLFRGSGMTGLCGMAEAKAYSTESGYAVMLWRPFLDTAPDELKLFLMEHNLSWREDETNQADDYLRNYLRHQVLPAIEKRIPEAEAAMVRAAKVMQREDEYFNSQAIAFLHQHACLDAPCCWIELDAFSSLHPALQVRVLRMASPVNLDFNQTEQLLAILPGDTVNLPERWQAYATRMRLHFVSPEWMPISMGTIHVLPFSGRMGDGIRLQAIPRKVWEACRLRYKETGDWIRPLGSPGRKSLQDYWVDKKVDRPFRGYMPLLCMGQQVIWSIGVGPGEEARVLSGEDAVLLQYEGYLPGEMPSSNLEKE